MPNRQRLSVPAEPLPRHDPSGPTEAPPPGTMPPDPFPNIGPLPTDPPLHEPRRIEPPNRREMEPA